MKMLNNKKIYFILISAISFSLSILLSCSGTQGFGRSTQFKQGLNNHQTTIDDYQIEEISINGILNAGNNEIGGISLESRINASPIIEQVEFSDIIDIEDDIVIKAKICDQDGELDQEIYSNLSIINSVSEVIYNEQAISVLSFTDENNSNSLCTEYIFRRDEGLPRGQYTLIIIVSDKYEGTSSFEQNFDVLLND